MPKAIRLILVLAFRFAGLFACMSPAAACAAPPAEIAKGPVTILDGSGTWRVLHAWNAPLVQTSVGLQNGATAAAGPSRSSGRGSAS